VLLAYHGMNRLWAPKALDTRYLAMISCQRGHWRTERPKRMPPLLPGAGPAPPAPVRGAPGLLRGGAPDPGDRPRLRVLPRLLPRPLPSFSPGWHIHLTQRDPRCEVTVTNLLSVSTGASLASVGHSSIACSNKQWPLITSGTPTWLRSKDLMRRAPCRRVESCGYAILYKWSYATYGVED
jgi:hypothetical protein